MRLHGVVVNYAEGTTIPNKVVHFTQSINIGDFYMVKPVKSGLVIISVKLHRNLY